MQLRTLGTLVALAPFRPVLSWNKEAHEAVAMTAMSAIKGNSLVNLKRLLDKKDAVDVSYWTHRVAEHYAVTASYLEQPQADKECAEGPQKPQSVDAAACEGGHCLLTGLKHFYARLAGGDKNTVPFLYPSNMEFTDADSLKWIIGLVGELHFPFAFGWVGDRMSKNVDGFYMEGSSNRVPTTLWTYYNDVLVKKSIQMRQNWWYSGWTHVNAMGQRFVDNEKRVFGTTLEENLQAFDRWAAENRRDYCTWAAERNPIDGPFVMTQNEYNNHFWRLKNKILVAGVRLSIVLTKILEVQTANKLRQGSGINVPLEVEAHVASMSGHLPWMTSLGLNASIVVAVLAVFYYFVMRKSCDTASVARAVNGAFNSKKKERDN